MTVKDNLMRYHDREKHLQLLSTLNTNNFGVKIHL